MATKANSKPNNLSLKEKGGLVESLWHAVDNAAGNLENVPGLVRRVLETGAWQKRVQDGEVYEHQRFIDFITTKPLAGCGWSPEKVEALIKDDPETLTLWRDAVQEKPGPKPESNSHNNIMRTNQGTSRSYTLSRLKRKNPKLFQRVVNGELSANAAAVEAGFRKKLTPFEQIVKLLPKISKQEQKAILQILAEALA